MSKKVKQPSESLRKAIKKSRPELSLSSIDSYIISLRMLHNKCFDDHKNKQLETKFLHDFTKIQKCLDEIENKNTKKNRLTSILVGLDAEEKKDDKLIDKYQNVLKTLMVSVNKELNSQEKTETQKDNWLEVSDIKSILNKMLADITTQKLFTKDKKLSKTEYSLVQKYILLRFFIAHPTRNNTSNTKVVTKAEYADLDDDEKDENYLVKDKGKYTFMLNKFKNIKRLGKKTIIVSDPINNLLNKWFTINKSGYMFTLNSGIEPLSSNGITKILNSIFKEYAQGKKLSTSLLRHILISEDLKDEPTIAEKTKEKENIATKYQHSTTVNDQYRKID
jgi:hypothetical protein